jgi:threonine dehydrogenase-like Zn-dependent dehydrogenase
VKKAMEATGQGVDATIELSGHPTAAETGAAITRQHGRFVQVAIVSVVDSWYNKNVAADDLSVDRTSLDSSAGVSIPRHPC